MPRFKITATRTDHYDVEALTEEMAVAIVRRDEQIPTSFGIPTVLEVKRVGQTRAERVAGYAGSEHPSTL